MTNLPADWQARLDRINELEERSHAAVIGGLLELVAVCLLLAAIAVWAAIASGA